MSNTKNLLPIVLLSVFVALPSNGSQQQKPAKPKNENTAKGSPSTLPPTLNSITINEQSPKEQKQAAQEQAHSIPALTDIWWPTVGLVIVGFLAFGAAMKTLGVIKRQTTAIENQVAEMQKTAIQTDKMIAEAIKQSAAAKTSADALVYSERAWIDGQLTRDLPDNTPGWDNTKIHNYALRLTNHGRSPALIISWQIGVATIVPHSRFRPEHITERTRKELHILLLPNKPEVIQMFDMAQWFPEWNDVLSKQREGVFDVIIRYSDTVSGLNKNASGTTYFAYSYTSFSPKFERMNWHNEYT
jgi:hypothetical protein